MGCLIRENNTDISASGSEKLTEGNYITNKPFNEWAKWSHSWEGTKTYGFTGGYNKNGLYPGQTEAQAENRAYNGFWKPQGLDKIKDPSVAICCMWCVFWTGNMHLIYQAVEQPNIPGGRPKPVPKKHAKLNQNIIDRINQTDSKTLFTNIKKQLGWFTIDNMSSEYHSGLIRRWFSVNYHENLLKNNQCSKTMSSSNFRQYLSKL